MKVLTNIAMVSAVALSSILISPGAISADDIKGKIAFYTHFTHFTDNGKWDEWTAAFEKKYPGTEVQILPVAGYRKEMPTRIASGEYGDVLNVLDNLPPEEYANFYAPLNDMKMTDTHQFVERYTVDGNIYGLIYGVNAEGVVYNKNYSRTVVEKECCQEMISKLSESRQVLSYCLYIGVLLE